jgi:hypothetical protein
VDPRDVIWLGGATGSGKTSISRILAYRHDLQLYNVDHRTFDHENRLGPRERDWTLPAGELVDVFVAYSHERWPLVVADLEALAATPAVIAEGPHLLPELVPTGAQAVFLVPSEQRIRATREERGSRPNISDRDVLLAAYIRGEAEKRGFAVVPVDRPLAEMVERVDALFTLDSLPREIDRPTVRRFENDVLARQVRLYRDSGEAPAGDWPLPFACECDEAGCADIVELTLADYERISAAGDRSPLRRSRS